MNEFEKCCYTKDIFVNFKQRLEELGCSLKGRLSRLRRPVVLGLGLTMSKGMCFTPHLVCMKERLRAIIGTVRCILRGE